MSAAKARPPATSASTASAAGVQVVTDTMGSSLSMMARTARRTRSARADDTKRAWARRRRSPSSPTQLGGDASDEVVGLVVGGQSDHAGEAADQGWHDDRRVDVVGAGRGQGLEPARLGPPELGAAPDRGQAVPAG